MTRFRPGDVVLVRFPFTELTGSKRRPAVVISPPAYSAARGDVVVMALTSRDQGDSRLQLLGWKQAGLPKPTWFKPLVSTISARVIERRLGRLTDDDRKIAAMAVGRLIDPVFRAAPAE